MIDFLSDNWIIIVCLLLGAIAGLFAGKFYQKKVAKVGSDEAVMIPAQNWNDIDMTE